VKSSGEKFFQKGLKCVGGKRNRGACKNAKGGGAPETCSQRTRKGGPDAFCKSAIKGELKLRKGKKIEGVRAAE